MVFHLINFKELKELLITNMDILENVNFKELKKIKIKKELDFYNTNISDIKVLEKIKFGNLKKLNLSGNKISNIDILESVGFKELKELDLSHNYILSNLWPRVLFYGYMCTSKTNWEHFVTYFISLTSFPSHNRSNLKYRDPKRQIPNGNVTFSIYYLQSLYNRGFS